MNTKKIYYSNYFLFFISTVLVLFDQVTKLAVKGFDFFGFSHEGLSYGENIPVLGNFLQWTYIENPGMAFGITFGDGKIFLSLFSVIASILLAILILKIKKFHYAIRLAFTLVLAGAVGNLIDRVFYGVIFGEMPLFYGKVVDFILVDIPDINLGGLYYTHWPVFNIADSCVSIGVILLLVYSKFLPTWEEIKTGIPNATTGSSQEQGDQDDKVN